VLSFLSLVVVATGFITKAEGKASADCKWGNILHFSVPLLTAVLM